MPDGFPDVLASKYRVERVLGRGGMGIVFQAVHRKLRTRVAIKVLNPLFAQQDALLKRFLREAVAASRLRSRYAVRVFDSDVTETGEPFIVMEFITGKDLAKKLKAGTPPATRVVDWMLQLCSAMHEAHVRRIVHRDLKPSNIYLADPDESVRVLDFGVSKIAEAGELTSGSEILGTPYYMAPEQLRGHLVDARCDVWSMGVIAYRALSGCLPCSSDSPDRNGIVAMLDTLSLPVTPLDKHRPDLPPGLVAAIMGALVKNVDERTASARDLALALEPFGSGAVHFEEVPENEQDLYLEPANESTPEPKGNADQRRFPPRAKTEWVDGQLAEIASGPITESQHSMTDSSKSTFGHWRSMPPSKAGTWWMAIVALAGFGLAMTGAMAMGRRPAKPSVPQALAEIQSSTPPSEPEKQAAKPEATEQTSKPNENQEPAKSEGPSAGASIPKPRTPLPPKKQPAPTPHKVPAAAKTPTPSQPLYLE